MAGGKIVKIMPENKKYTFIDLFAGRENKNFSN